VAPTTIVLVRHGERITPDGDVALSEKGRERAKALAYAIADLNLRAIYTSQMIRTIETAAPAAETARLKSELVPVEKSDVLVEKLKQLPPGSSALVVNHSGTIPTIVEKLGAGKIAPVREDEFDRLLIVTIPATGAPSVVTLRYGGP
jgi:broad specificity phosphatase PhoE